MKVRMAVEQPNKDAFIEQVMRKYHFSTEEKEALQQVYEKVRTYMAPYAIYRINTRMRGVPLLDAEQSALVAMTLGEGVDRLQEYYEQEHALSESYMVECVANELLLQMYADFNSELSEIPSPLCEAVCICRRGNSARWHAEAACRGIWQTAGRYRTGK